MISRGRNIGINKTRLTVVLCFICSLTLLNSQVQDPPKKKAEPKKVPVTQSFKGDTLKLKATPLPDSIYKRQEIQLAELDSLIKAKQKK